MIRFSVRGSAAPKGSGRAMPKRGGGAVFVPSGSKVNQEKLADWKTAMRNAAADAIAPRVDPPYVNQPLRLEIEFRMRRPSGHYSKRKKDFGQILPQYIAARPISPPDSSKLLRSTEDNMIGIVMDDDSRIVDTHITKVYAKAGEEGATIAVMSIDEWDMWRAGADVEDCSPLELFRGDAIDTPEVIAHFGGEIPTVRTSDESRISSSEGGFKYGT